MIKRVLNTLAESYYIKITAGVVTGWSMALKNINNELMWAALPSYIENKPDGYKPTPGEFAHHCKSYKKAHIKGKRIENKPTDQKQLTTPEAAEAYKNINRTIASKRKSGEIDQPENGKTKCEPLIIDECFSSDGEPHSYRCYGHVEFNHMRKEVWRQFTETISSIDHLFFRDGRKYDRDDNGHALRAINTLVKCKSDNPGGFPMTIGRLS